MNRRIGDEIKDIVQNAINTKDFRQLNKDISDTVNGALDEVHKSLFNSGNRQNWRKPDIDIHVNGPQDNNNSTRADNFTNRYGQAYHRNRNEKRNYRSYNNQRQDFSYSAGANQNTTKQQAPAVRTQPFPVVPVGNVAGILLTVFGSIGFGITGLAIVALCIIGQITAQIAFFGTIALYILPLFFINLILFYQGSRFRKRIRRFRRYIGIFQNQGYYTLKELSDRLNKSKKSIIKELRKMISIGMFPEGHIDKQETCIILNHECYQKYLELQQNEFRRKMGTLEENANHSRDQLDSPASSATAAVDEETRSAIENGRSYIRQIKEANDAIPGEAISKKLIYLEELLNKIFNHIEQHPNQLPQIQQFMSYYLPTTLKLVNAYKDFDKESIQGENITSAKNEIDLTLDTINQAFEKLYDSFFLNAAMDISTDISVLETLLAQEGLTQKDFKTNQSMGGLTNE